MALWLAYADWTIYLAASPDIQGTANIEAFIDTSCRRASMARNMRDIGWIQPRILTTSVITPAGERCSFRLEIDTLPEGDQSKMVIRKLARQEKIPLAISREGDPVPKKGQA
ncbi:MAG: hypothetical protein ABSC32_07065 [Steroidobacteraceae bacterium]